MVDEELGSARGVGAVSRELRIEHDAVFGCERVVSPVDKDGYGRDPRTRRLAHLLAWEEAHGPIPKGMFVDHSCRNRACRALHHLELVTKSENELRKSFKHRLKRKACSRGHDLDLHRVITPADGVVCRACNVTAKGTST